MASDALIAELDAYAPEFSQRADRGGYLDRAARRVSSERYGSVYVDAVCCVAAHMLELSERRRAGMAGVGPITSQSEGSVSFGSSEKGKAAYYGSTDHGLAFLDLRSLVRPGPVLLDDNTAESSSPRT